MSAYYTFVCSLPYLSFEGEPPMTPKEFVERAAFYLKDEESAEAPTHPILAGFVRVRVEANASKTLTAALDPQAFTVVGEDGKRRPGSGRWTLYAGFGQPDARTEELTGQRCLSAAIM